jgi:excisionase family DNA binding protein
MITTTTDLLSLAEVAARLGCSTQTVRRRIASGDLQAIRLGPDERYPLRVFASEVERLLRPAGAEGRDAA